jgi:hypothetical protein
MKIFDANISGSLNVSGSARFFGDLTVDGTINAAISGTSTNALALNTTGSARFATTGSNTFNANQTITGSLYVSNDVVINGTSYTASTSGTSGSSGSSGTSGSSGSSGTSGTSGSDGSSGSSGTAGTSGTSITTSGTNNKVVKFTSSSTVGDSSITDDGTTVTIGGNLVVSGTTTTINSTTLEIGDNIISLNGSGAANAGLVVRDATASTLISGSLLWNTTSDYWMAGPLGSELQIVTVSGTQTLTDKQLTSLGVGTAAPATTGLIRATNDVIAYYSSDERLKDNFEVITNPLDKLKQINGYSFDWIPMEGIHENEGHDIGVKAQEIEAVLPEIVTTRDNGYKAVKYDKLVALLIETNKELLNRIEALEAKIK